MALRNGSRFAVSMAEVFPHGCHLMPESITEAQDYNEQTRRAGAVCPRESSAVVRPLRLCTFGARRAASRRQPRTPARASYRRHVPVGHGIAGRGRPPWALQS